MLGTPRRIIVQQLGMQAGQLVCRTVTQGLLHCSLLALVSLRPLRPGTIHDDLAQVIAGGAERGDLVTPGVPEFGEAVEEDEA